MNASAEDVEYVAERLADAFVGSFSMGPLEQFKFAATCRRVFGDTTGRVDAFRILCALASANPDLAKCMGEAVKA